MSLDILAVGGLAVVGYFVYKQLKDRPAAGPAEEPPTSWNCTSCDSAKNVYACKTLPMSHPLKNNQTWPPGKANISRAREAAYDNVNPSYVAPGGTGFWWRDATGTCAINTF